MKTCIQVCKFCNEESTKTHVMNPAALNWTISCLVHSSVNMSTHLRQTVDPPHFTDKHQTSMLETWVPSSKCLTPSFREV